jgi:hypothetical protein
MRPKPLLAASLILIAAIVSSYQYVSAHTTVTVGDYEIEVGWVDEPPVVGQQNDIVVNVSNTKDESAVVDISNLTVAVTYGGQTKTLALQPLGEDTVNQYIAPILPTVAGQYTVQLRGQIDTTDVSTDVSPEEVASADTLQFPAAESAGAQASSGLGWSDWLSILGAICGVAGLILALLARRRVRA